ncbi:hypothetical protein E9529_11955 [Blastococcus sp. KM273128]|uniref:hypothetical protein n=1 Tax=Blastococcus sp. KM273128 TaxID=2570314 RepID=UPI001F1D7187|nr:hypothetical protein [Blastococcus sp. KM273128]MCF6744982.1 hypothetical protein [Blastococcus sp. KM273128]
MPVRFAEVAVIVLIGDGVVGALFPVRHARRWLRGPRFWRRAMRPFVEHPEVTRGAAVVEAVAGVWWAARLPARAR